MFDIYRVLYQFDGRVVEILALIPAARHSRVRFEASNSWQPLPSYPKIKRSSSSTSAPRDARQHGAAASHTHGVLRLVLRTDGEIVSEVVPHLGYLHRCAEKIGENVLPIQFIPYTDRMDYLAAMNMNLGYALAIEKLCGMKIPEKAQVIRVLVCELGRIASHLVAMGTYGLDLGTFSPFLYAFREREMILDLFEEVCGARLTYSYLTIGALMTGPTAGSITSRASSIILSRVFPNITRC